jgi:streptomycin 6-kinase
MKLELPPEFTQTIQSAFGGDSKRWLESLPDLLDEASRRWGLTDIQPLPNLSYNFVALAQSGASDSERSRIVPVGGSAARSSRPSTTPQRERGSAQEQVILKLGVPNRELTSEIAALRLYNGRGACRLLEADAQKGMLLLERLLPGRTLSMLEDDEQATRIAAEVMSLLWQPGPENQDSFIQLKDWFSGFKRLRQQFEGGTGRLPEKLVATAEALSQELLAENKDEALLHGDFHHFNVLESRRGWLAIDPKGVIGPHGYDVGPLLINPIDHFLNGSNPKSQTEKRIAILSEMLDMERERIRAWGICHAVLSAWWSIEDNDPGWGDYSVGCAEIFMMVQK